MLLCGGTADMSIGLRASCAAVRRRLLCIFFFFQAEDGIRDYKVTGVQTCALPICSATQMPGGAHHHHQPPRTALFAKPSRSISPQFHSPAGEPVGDPPRPRKIGRASCREGGRSRGAADYLKKKKIKNVQGSHRMSS